MHFLGYLILSFAKLLGLVINIYLYIIAAAVLISWVNADPSNPIVRAIRSLTEPIFGIARKIVPGKLYRTGFDFSPLASLIIIILIDTFVVGTLTEFARSLILK